MAQMRADRATVRIGQKRSSADGGNIFSLGSVVMHSDSQNAGRLSASSADRLLIALLQRILPSLLHGRLTINVKGSECLTIYGRLQGPNAQITVHSWKLFWRLITNADLGFAESYIAGEFSSPDLAALVELGSRNYEMTRWTRWLRMPALPGRLRHALNRNTRRGSRRNIAAHYDLGNDFFAHWLDGGMNYSAALFSSAGQTLEEAQFAKLDRASELLELSGGEDVLEIGCGWGGLAERLVERHGCLVTGITLSEEQLAFAKKRLSDRGLDMWTDLRLEDYRDTRQAFDRIVSIEMLEAVGAAYWSTYFDKLRANLRPGGVAVLQVITIAEEYFESYRRRPDFIQKYIFPGGMLPTRGIIEREVVAAGLRLSSCEFFGKSYARTLSEWLRRFERALPAIHARGFDAQFNRTWEYYLAYCRAGFEAGFLDVGLYQIRRI
jgi:cyclopropane-fatty-acyl-phospholipid synthase